MSVLSIHIIVHLRNDKQAPPTHPYRISPEIPDTTSLRVRVCQGAHRGSPHTYTYSHSCWKPFSYNIHIVWSATAVVHIAIVRYFKVLVKVLVTLQLISMILLCQCTLIKPIQTPSLQDMSPSQECSKMVLN